ncbi:MAG TPA: phospholipase D family protein [Gammaproteobacteria bacterium]|nr:phospholipase D family protein [Gammaproteobacteria bacterium]
MAFHFQSPGIAGGTTLLECLLEASSRASSGWGAFAYASRQGVRLLFHDEVFTRFLRDGDFKVVVGTDSITNTRAIESLRAFGDQHESFECKAFYQNPVRKLFHPKFCWFEHKNARGHVIGGTRITGSGNLTGGGLTTNWEAFTVSRLNAAAIRAEREKWLAWNLASAPFLKALDDADVLARAAANVRVPRSAQRVPAPAQPGIAPAEAEDNFAEDIVVDAPAAANDVLVAEIPKSKERWKQANFDVDNYEQFFGFTRGQVRRVVLQHVTPNGVLGDVEARPGVEVASKNYRLELEAASGLAYPAGGRPIGVFVKTEDRVFRYCLLMPGSPGYAQVTAFLLANWHGGRNKVSRVRTHAATLRVSWPGAPAQLLPV